MRLDYQILLKSTPPTLVDGSSPDSGMRKTSVFSTMLDTQTIIVLFVLFCKQIHVLAYQKFCFRNSSLSVLISGK